MDFAKSDIQTMLLDSAERLLAEQAHVEYWREQFHSATGFDEARWAQFAELGWLAARHRGRIDRFSDNAGIVFFDEPASCVRMAMDLLRAVYPIELVSQSWQMLALRADVAPASVTAGTA